MEAAREKMLREVMAADFTCYDLGLYLNTHPYDQRAMSIFITSANNAKMLRQNYENLYGPLFATSSRTFPWPWINDPWPWEG